MLSTLHIGAGGTGHFNQAAGTGSLAWALLLAGGAGGTGAGGTGNHTLGSG